MRTAMMLIVLSSAFAQDRPTIAQQRQVCREIVEQDAPDGSTAYRAAFCFASTGDFASAVNAKQDCAGSQYHELDFWKGEWAVISSREQIAIASVEPVLNGGSLLERWRSEDPGKSILAFHFYDPIT